MKQNNLNKVSYLHSRIALKARLLNKAKLLELLSIYPGLERIREGKAMIYLIREESHESRFYTVEFAPSGIAINIFSKQSPLDLLQEGLLRLLSLASFVERVYVFDIASIFPYLIEVLARENLVKKFNPQENAQTEVAVSGMILAKRIVSLKRETGLLKRQMEYQSERIVALLSLLLQSRSSGRCSVSRTAKEIGAAKAEIRAAVNRALEDGRNVTWHDSDTFSVVGT